MKKIGILKYGAGNIMSVYNMILKARGNPFIVSNKNELKNIEILILPGVGSYDNAIIKLKKKGFYDLIIKHVDDGKVLLGICLGFQLLFRGSDEGNLDGFGFFDDKLTQFKPINNFKKLHMGWNYIHTSNYLFSSYNKNKFYFVHKYYSKLVDSDFCSSTCNYSEKFCSSVEKNNIIGVQFHPEKSHNYGLSFFKKFIQKYAQL